MFEQFNQVIKKPQTKEKEKRKPVFLFNEVQRRIFKLREARKERESNKDLKIQYHNAMQQAKMLARSNSILTLDCQADFLVKN